MGGGGEVSSLTDILMNTRIPLQAFVKCFWGYFENISQKGLTKGVLNVVISMVQNLLRNSVTEGGKNGYYFSV